MIDVVDNNYNNALINYIILNYFLFIIQKWISM